MAYLIVTQTPSPRAFRPMQLATVHTGETIQLQAVHFLGNDPVFSQSYLYFAPKEQCLVRIKQHAESWQIESLGANIRTEYQDRPLFGFQSRTLHFGQKFYLGAYGFLFRPTCFDLDWLSWNVIQLAETFHLKRDREVLPILADALEEAGCYEPDILESCRRAEREDAWIAHWITFEQERRQTDQFRYAA